MNRPYPGDKHREYCLGTNTYPRQGVRPVTYSRLANWYSTRLTTACTVLA